MYTGTLIDELMQAVERSEKRSQANSQEEQLTYFYGMAQSELVRFESQLVGAA